MKLTTDMLRAMHRTPVFASYEKPVVPAPAEPDPYQEPEDAFVGPEKLLHRDFAADMGRRGVHLVHARTDKASTIESGTPDFHCMFTGADGVTRGCAIEFKVKGKKPSFRQRCCLAEMRRLKIPVVVAWSLKAAIDFAKEALKL